MRGHPRKYKYYRICVYRCKRCGEVFNETMAYYIHDGEISGVQRHLCSPGVMGIAELIGYDIPCERLKKKL